MNVHPQHSRNYRRKVVSASRIATNASVTSSNDAVQTWLRGNSSKTRLRSGLLGVPLILGISLQGHDNSLAATLGGKVLAVIELERLHKHRYFFLDILRHRLLSRTRTLEEAVVRYVVPALVQLCEIVSPQLARLANRKLQSPCHLEYDVASHVGHYGIDVLKNFVRADRWMTVDHHHAHAALGWLDSPFYNNDLAIGTARKAEKTFVLSYDGWGNDGTLRTFIARAGDAELEPLGRPLVGLSLGHNYRLASMVARELSWGTRYGSIPPYGKEACDEQGYDFIRMMNADLALSGSFMAFAATGKLREKWLPGALMLMRRGVWEDALWPSPFGGFCRLIGESHGCQYFNCDGADEETSRELDRDFAATAQVVFEKVVISIVEARLALLGGQLPTSFVITGGCALNVKVNSALARYFNLPTYVPSAPGDDGLAVGAAWLVTPPKRSHGVRTTQFGGAPLTFGIGLWLDEHRLAQMASRWGATQLSSIDWLARSMLDGAIFAVARGRAEFGPRALGHRSFLTGANRAEQKVRLNRLKERQWYRPCAPVVAVEDLERIFEKGADLAVGTPYMSFAPPLQDWVAEKLPAIAHLDNTARPQSVHRDSDPWLHGLLDAVRSASDQSPAVGVLINTSLNPKGYPMVADALDALLMFCLPNGYELDYVLIEETTLFERDAVISRGLCRTGSSF